MHKLCNSKKQTTQNTAKQNYPGSVASDDTRPGNEMGLLYNALKPTLVNKSETLTSIELQGPTELRSISELNLWLAFQRTFISLILCSD